MRGHQHLGDPSLTQNQGNTLGDRPCVRQSKLYREHVGGNAMKDIMGQTELKWDTTQSQGAYAGKKVFDHNANNNNNNNNANKNKNANNKVEGGEREEEAPQNMQQQQQMQQQQPIGNNENEVEISLDAPENMSPKQQQQTTQTQTQQQTTDETGKQQVGATPVASRSFRPGAGYANRQTYNIFTGQ